MLSENTIKKISVVLPTYNELKSLPVVVDQIIDIFDQSSYQLEILVIDNASNDGTVELIRSMCREHPFIKAIINTNNFGQIRSPFYGILQAGGDAIIHLPSDGEVPSKIIPELLLEWEKGFRVVHAVKEYTTRSSLRFLKELFQKTLNRYTSTEMTFNSSGYGLLDASVVREMRKIKSIYPYYRGLINELGGEGSIVKYQHVNRKEGISKNNLLSLTDYALVGIVNYSKIPLRIMMVFGLIGASISFLVGFGYFILKLLDFDGFQAGLVPLAALSLFMHGLTLFFIGLIGEYIYHIFINTRGHPLVAESETINFENRDQ